MTKTWFITGASRGFGGEIAQVKIAALQTELGRWKTLSVSTDGNSAAT